MQHLLVYQVLETIPQVCYKTDLNLNKLTTKWALVVDFEHHSIRVGNLENKISEKLHCKPNWHTRKGTKIKMTLVQFGNHLW